MLDLQALKQQLRELDEEIERKELELTELYGVRESLGGARRPAMAPRLPYDPSEAKSAIITPEEAQIAHKWTAEQQALMDAEAARIREASHRYNQNMPLPRSSVKRNEVKIPPGVKPAEVVPREMAEWLNT
jgi:hypothetical protein